MFKLGLLLSVLAVELCAAPVRVFTWPESHGLKVITYKPSDKGYLAWMEGGYSSVGCKGKDFSAYYLTPCMVKAQFAILENSLKELGIKERFEYELIYQILPEEEIHNLVDRWTSPDLDILFVIDTKGNAEGYTRTTQLNKSTVGLKASKAQIFQLAHLFRHEMTHAMGFDGHLYDPTGWTYKGCGQTINVRPYGLSGLSKDCRNRTFVGSWVPDNGSCAKHEMLKPDLYSTSWNVPVYGEIFKAVFQCYFIGTPLKFPSIDECFKILDDPKVRACLI
jgi:hypothetical protein